MASLEQPIVRLIDLWKGKIKEYSVDQAPSYIAVSHLWSEKLFPPESKNGVRKSQGIKIIKKAFLSDSTGRGGDCHVWVDTYCIRQNDEADKARQIRHMGEIYRRASLVLVVMKNEIPVSSKTFERYSAYIDQYMDEEGYPKPIEFCLPKLILWPGLSHILRVAELPWFDRIWTAQEYILAENIAWIDSNGNLLQIPSGFLSRLFTYWNVGTSMDEQCGDSRYAPWPWELARLQHFDLLCRLREKKISPMYSLHVNQLRASTHLQDKIYGIMGSTGINIEADYNLSLNEIWPEWFEQSLRAGHLIWLMSPRTYRSRHSPATMATQKNCIMPEYEFNFQALAGSNLMDLTPFPNKKPVKVIDGSVGVHGRLVGTCVLDKFLGCVGFGRSHVFQSWAEEIGRASRGDLETATRILKVLVPKDLNSGRHVAAAKEICNSLDVLKAGVEETQKQEQMFAVAKKLFERLAPPKYASSHLLNSRVHERIYLGSLQNQNQKKDILIAVQHDDSGENLTMIPESEDAIIQAIDVNGITSSKRSRIQERALIIVSRLSVAGGSSHRKPFHKLGVSYPLNTIELCEVVENEKPPEVYVIDAPMKRIWIGGKDCDSCKCTHTKEAEETTEACEHLQMRQKTWTDEQFGPYTERGVHNIGMGLPFGLSNSEDLTSRNGRLRVSRNQSRKKDQANHTLRASPDTISTAK